MSKCRILASHPLSKRQPGCRRWLSNTRTYIDNSDDSAGAASDSTVAPSQLLRYALSGDPKIDPTTASHTTQIKLDKELELILSKQRFGKRHRRGHLISLPGTRVPTDLQDVGNLQELQLWFEQYIAAGSRKIPAKLLKNALLRCEKSSSALEILSVLSAFKSRLKDVERPSILREISLTGLNYAFQSLSVPAIRYHLDSIETPMHPIATEHLVQCLLRTLRTVRFANPAYNTRPILKLVAEPRAVSKSSKNKMLVDLVQFSYGTHSSFIELLSELGASERAHGMIWEALMKSMFKKQPSSKTLSSVSIDDAYKSVMVFFKSGMTKYAVSCMNQISRTAKIIPPSLQVSSDLAAVLNANGLDVPSTIGKPIQRALALKQQGTASTDDVKVSDDMIDFSMVQSLLARINSRGTSVSASEIADLIDALNDYAGLTIPLFSESSENRRVEYAWSPQWVPGVSTSAMISFSQTSQTLGLLRAQISSRGIIFTADRSRNLLQLGHLVRRELISAGQGDATQEDGTDAWTKTGYLVVFDRVSAEYLVIYIGEDITIIDPEYKHHAGDSSSVEFEQHPFLGSLAHVCMPTSVQDLRRGIRDAIEPVKNAANRYVLDLDSGAGLRP